MLVVTRMVDVKCERVAYLFCPQYKGLALDDILAKLDDHPEVEQYLPDEQDRHRIPRQWAINIFQSVVGKPFAVWAQGAMQVRNEKHVEKHKLMIAMDPQVAEIFARSTSVSSKYFWC